MLKKRQGELFGENPTPLQMVDNTSANAASYTVRRPEPAAWQETAMSGNQGANVGATRFA